MKIKKQSNLKKATKLGYILNLKKAMKTTDYFIKKITSEKIRLAMEFADLKNDMKEFNQVLYYLGERQEGIGKTENNIKVRIYAQSISVSIAIPTPKFHMNFQQVFFMGLDLESTIFTEESFVLDEYSFKQIKSIKLTRVVEIVRNLLKKIVED